MMPMGKVKLCDNRLSRGLATISKEIFGAKPKDKDGKAEPKNVLPKQKSLK